MQMQNGEGFPHAVDGRAADDFETQMLVKTKGLWIFFVDVHCVCSQLVDGKKQQTFPHTPAKMVRERDKKHFNFV